MPLDPGRRLGPYEILAPLGAGGMGEVYRARDTRLGREVAVKVLPQNLAVTREMRARFEREARLVSSLNHPRICVLHDVGHQDGTDYLVMELVAGEPLDQWIVRGPMPEPEVVAIGIQIAEALEAAHEQGIVHRDLKPTNIVLNAKGQVKVLDFGLARLMRSGGGQNLTTNLTGSDVTAGTVPYMAPEQLLGHEVDGRADVFSLGVVLYELITGRSPFKTKLLTALVYEIIHQPVSSPRLLNAQISAGLESVILKCLEKNPANRYESPRGLIADLRALAAGEAFAVRARRTRPQTARLATVAGSVVVVAILAALAALDAGGWWERARLWMRPPLVHSIAVLPLANLSGDPAQDFLADGLSEELIQAFSHINGLSVIARGSVMRYKGSHLSLAEIARALGVEAVLEGTIRKNGERALVSVELVRAATGANLWAEQYDRPVGDLLHLQGEVATAVANQVRLSLTGREKHGLAQSHPVKPEAHEAYLRGRFYWNEFTVEGFRTAVDQFKHALEIQPDYAMAYEGMADAYLGLSTLALDPKEAMPRARAAVDRALELDPDLAEAYASRAAVKAFYDWNWRAAEQDFRVAIEKAPGSAQPRLDYGYMLVVLGRFDEATRQLARAHALDPLSSFISCVQLWPLYEGRKYDEVIRAAQEVVSVDSTAWNAHQVMGQAYVARGQFAEAYAAGIKARRSHGIIDTTTAFADIYAAMGRRDLARRKLEALIRQPPAPPSYEIGILYGMLGDKDHAFEWLGREVDRRSEAIVFLKVDPQADPLRSDPRFTQLLRRMNLE